MTFVAAVEVICKNILDIIFVLDESGSVGLTNFDLMKSFLSRLVAAFDIDRGNTRVGLVAYSDDIGESFNLSDHSTVSSVQSAVTSLSYSGGLTQTDYALEYVRETMLTSDAGDRDKASNVVVVFTDGRSTDSSATKVSIQVWHNDWLGSVVTALDSRSIGHCRAATLGKLFTPLCLCHQAV